MTVNVLGRRLPAAATYAAALATALVLLLIAIGAAILQTNRSAELNIAVRSSIETRSHLRMLLRGLQDAETGQRGYLITGEEPYLKPYNDGIEVVPRELAALEAAAVGDTAREAEAAQMRELSERKLRELADTIELRRNGQTARANALVRTNMGRATMDELRAILNVAEQREQGAVTERMAEVDRGGERLQLVMLLAGVLMIAIGVLMVVTVRNAMAELRGSRDNAEAANRRLVQEMTGREQAESKMRQMQKMEAIGQLTGGVAHDFNNMLAVIISALQLAQRKLARNETGDVQRFMDAAMDGARRAAILTSRLLAFARRQPLTPSVMDINRIVSGMSELLRRTLGEHIDFETVLAGGLWKVNADTNELENAIVNICVNARDAMPNGGKLTIETANAHLDEEYARLNIDVTAGQYVMIAITDTGAGMPADVRAKAFDPFFTTKEIGKGTGLGLSHVHGFLKQSGGHVAIYSEVGVGTTLKLYLPRTQLAESEESAAPQTDEIPQGDAATIVLVVEDEERVRLLSVASLRELGYTVLHASSGAEALAKLEANQGVSLLFTDVVMPGMSGRVLSEEARKKRPELKVLYTTGYTQNAIVHNGVLDADARLLLKPYSLSELARKVHSVLSE